MGTAQNLRENGSGRSESAFPCRKPVTPRRRVVGAQETGGVFGREATILGISAAAALLGVVIQLLG